MHEYKQRDIQECLGERRLVFIGDSTTRQIFLAVAKKLDEDRAEEEILDVYYKEQDIEFTSADVTAQFIWDPWLNSTSLEQELKKFRAEPSLDGNEVDESAGLILLGAPGLFYARHGGENYFRGFRDSIDSVIPYMDHATSDSDWPVSRHFQSRSNPPNLLLLAPVQVPRYQALSPSREETITPQKIDLMNDYLHQVSAYTNADVVWSYSSMTGVGRGAYGESGLHVIDNVAHRRADVLLNLRCNGVSAMRGYPFNRTCCSSYKRPNKIQRMILLGGILVLPGLLFFRRKHVLRIGRLLPVAEVCNALAILALILCYCFYADRTQIFEKSRMLYQGREFIVPCLAIAVTGISSARENKVPLATNRTKYDKIHNQEFLSPDQIDEWKGWMQAFLLIYHYTHASKVLWIYEIARILVASYLFIAGYEHTLYFLKTGDYSLKYIATVLIRLNLLSCILPYIMGTDYMFYYFPPLFSFWFLVNYITFRIGFRYNSNVNFVLGKIILSAALTTAFTMTRGILEFVSVLLEHSCGISWDMADWRLYIFLDMYIVYVGMIMAILCQRLSQVNSGTLATRHPLDIFLRSTTTRTTLFTTITVLAATILLSGFWILTRRSPDNEDYNWWLPYISCVPILSFLTLRNCHRLLRNYHSAAFAWLGRFSIEVYVLQYHIWLAGDSSGLLRLGLFNQWTEAAILTPSFLWISWYAADVTRRLTTWVVGGPAPPQLPLGAGVHEDMDRAKYSPAAISPRGQDGEGTPSKELRFGLGRGRMVVLVGGSLMRLKADLRLRLMGLGVLLWVGNFIYR
jgi:N-acetylneuraminate 9-O-acetyltransferase